MRLPSSFCPPANKNLELERIIENVKHIPIHASNPRDNIKKLRRALDSLICKTEKDVVIKSADKGDIIVIMSPEFYLSMCMDELSNTDYYEMVGEIDPSPLVMEAVTSFAERYRHSLTPNEYVYLKESKYAMANFYMLPKLHKSSYLSGILGSKRYVHIADFHQKIDGRPIVGGPCFYTSGLSKMVDIILQPILTLIPHILIS